LKVYGLEISQNDLYQYVGVVNGIRKGYGDCDWRICLKPSGGICEGDLLCDIHNMFS
jgi:hypothetical protein